MLWISFGSAKVAHGDYRRPTIQKFLNGGQCSPDAAIIADFALGGMGNIEINPYKNLAPLKVGGEVG